jgi:hypothetical protein
MYGLKPVPFREKDVHQGVKRVCESRKRNNKR